MTEATGLSKAFIADAYDDLAADYDRIGPRVFSHFGRRLVELAGPEPGERVLDVGAGRGASLLPAAGRVGPTGAVVGVDLSARLVELATVEIAVRGLTNASVKVMDAEQLDFADGSFDLILCGFTLQHLLDPDRALAEFRRVLRPGGRLALATWAERPPLMTWIRDELKRLHPIPHLIVRPFDRAAELEHALTAAGFGAVRTLVEAADVVYRDAAEWWRSNWSLTQRGALETLDLDTLEGLRRAAVLATSAYSQPDGIHQTWAALFALGHRPV